MDKQSLKQSIQAKGSFLCIGLDPDWQKIPANLQSDPEPILKFNKAIIDATADYAVAYKPNLAFYEAMGSEGWDVLKSTLSYIPDGLFTIADAKRSDIGNTARNYAKAFFEEMNFDGITLSPYMGKDAIAPFLEYDGKWAIILALTSNAGSNDFQTLENDGKPLYAQVIDKGLAWGSDDQIMFVIGGTRASYLKTVREHCPNHFLLIPGIGKQGGSIEQVASKAMNSDYGILVNVSRSILYAGDGEDFAQEARKAAKAYQEIMAQWV